MMNHHLALAAVHAALAFILLAEGFFAHSALVLIAAAIYASMPQARR